MVWGYVTSIVVRLSVSFAVSLKDMHYSYVTCSLFLWGLDSQLLVAFSRNGRNNVKCYGVSKLKGGA